MDRSQWQILQEMLAQRQAYNQGGSGVPGMPGAQSGAASPWDEVPGGGSTANALPLANPLADERARLQKLSDDALVNALLGYGIAGGSLAAGPNPLTLLGALGGGAYGIINNQISRNAGANARRLGYQGN